MRHQKVRNRLNLTTAHRQALLRNLATALFGNERITTTAVKARALRPFAEKLITLAKRGDLHARRLAGRHVHDGTTLGKLFGELAERYRNRAGGYVRILKVGARLGDCAPTSLVELVDAKPRTAPETEAADAKADKQSKAKATKGKAAKTSAA